MSGIKEHPIIIVMSLWARRSGGLLRKSEVVGQRLFEVCCSWEWGVCGFYSPLCETGREVGGLSVFLGGCKVAKLDVAGRAKSLHLGIDLCWV